MASNKEWAGLAVVSVLVGGLVVALNPGFGILGFIGGVAFAAVFGAVLIKTADLICYVGSSIVKIIAWPFIKISGPLCVAGVLGLIFGILINLATPWLGSMVATCGFFTLLFGAFCEYLKKAMSPPIPKPEGTMTEQLDRYNKR